ncbi:cyclic nucleotide-binding domain-containing protein [Phyllobacterium zundukense]|uniref:Cyclic nucleotide-binding domain-containing protein n=1 Tax=Phyllobacterium zundukense TaxID=1867719 RepID=A0ACD4D274_9HYPH|nr:cyclic nucleotide-binding domain-containing protein [Phyllobacterium zundukense]UXN59899.1 cyclic nucleotide-binding domain-containing protein [Phyllobacterium zundukense]
MIGANNIIHDPAPVVALKGIDAFAMDIELQFRVRHPSDRIPARNELIDLVYRQCIETGISLALPASSSVLVENIHTNHASQATLQELLQSNPIFADIEQAELHKLAASAKLRQYRPGAIIFEAADSASNLMIVRSGAASALYDGAEVLRLAPGAIFGQIDGVPRTTKYEALTVVETYEIDGLTLATLFKDHPEMQDNLTRHLSGITGNGSAAGSSRGEHASILRTVRGLLGK